MNAESIFPIIDGYIRLITIHLAIYTVRSYHPIIKTWIRARAASHMRNDLDSDDTLSETEDHLLNSRHERPEPRSSSVSLST